MSMQSCEDPVPVDAGAAPLSPTARSTVGRLRERAATERAALYDVLDAGLVGHLGMVVDGAPVVIPTAYGRAGDTLYLHGSTGARSLRLATEGAPVCFAVTHLDALVHARAVMHFSMNYRSAVVHGTARRLTGEEELAGLRAITEHLAPGAWDVARPPSAKERAATAVLSLPLAEASVKVRTGPPKDDPEDVAAGGVWAGLVPLVTGWGTPVSGPDLEPGVPVPAHVLERR